MELVANMISLLRILAICLIHEVWWSGFFGHDNARECEQASGCKQRENKLSPRALRRDGFIAGTGAMGVNHTGDILSCDQGQVNAVVQAQRHAAKDPRAGAAKVHVQPII